MSKAPEIREQLGRWIDGEISLQQFEDWFLPSTWNLHVENDAEAESLADEIELYLSEYSDRVLSLADLRGELTRIARPFAEARVDAFRESQASPCMIAESQEIDLDWGTTRKPQGRWTGSPIAEWRLQHG
jgi:hypothetical protein